MLVVHSDAPFSKSQQLKRTEFENDDEIKELKESLQEVEAKRNFIVNRIEDLAKKFPRTGYEGSTIQENPKLNEIELHKKVNFQHEAKYNEVTMLEKQSRLNQIIKEDRKNKRDMYHIARVTRKIDTIRKDTKIQKDTLKNNNKEKDKKVEYLHKYGAQIRENQREGVRESQNKVLDMKLDKFYSRKSESVLNHQLIIHQKKQHELSMLKKCNYIKYQTNIAKIRMDCVLRDRLESINSR